MRKVILIVIVIAIMIMIIIIILILIVILILIFLPLSFLFFLTLKKRLRREGRYTSHAIFLFRSCNYLVCFIGRDDNYFTTHLSLSWWNI